jgi:hypothetical protein
VSSTSLRGFEQRIARGVLILLETSVERCPWALPFSAELGECGARVRHSLSSLGPSDVELESREAFRRAETTPAMRAVIPPAEELQGPRSSRPPCLVTKILPPPKSE